MVKSNYCGKVRYTSEKEAIQQEVYLSVRYNNIQRHYKCKLCKGYHLTTIKRNRNLYKSD